MSSPTGFRTKGKGKNRRVYPVYKGYRGFHKGNMTISSVVEAQQMRSPTAQRIDAQRRAPIAKNEEEWINAPNRTDLPGVDTPRTLALPAPTQTKSQATIEMWQQYRQNYESGKWQGGIDKYRERLVGYRASLVLGRDFQEDTEAYYKRAGLKEFDDWAASEVKGIDATKPEIIAIKATGPDGDSTTFKNFESNQEAEKIKHNLEARPQVWPKVEVITESPKAQVSGSTATYNKATGWLSITFDSIPSVETRNQLKSEGFRYVPYDKRWRASYTPDREQKLKAMSGSVEQIDIKPNWAAKAEHAADMAEKHVEKSNEAYERSSKIADAIPFGQPILVGHHSEKHHRADLERIRNAMDKSVEERKIAETYQDRAERYGQKATGESPGLIYRRIQKLEADKRRMERELAAGESGKESLYYSGHLSESRKDEIKQWINHYTQRLTIEQEKYKASGGIVADNQQFKPGDRVHTRWGTGTLGSISKKTCRVKLDGKDHGIYPNSKGESLLSVDDLKSKA